MAHIVVTAYCVCEVFDVKDRSRKVKMPKPQKPAHPAVPALEWLSDLSGRAARATAIGSRRILIENHTGILDYTAEEVRLCTACGPLCIHGSDLTLCEVRPSALIVHGCIRQVDLPQEGSAQ